MSTEQLPVLTPKFVLGFFVLVAGILLTVDNLGLADTRGVFRYWPVGVIALGAVMVTRTGEGSGRVGSVVLMVVGGWLLLNTLDVVDAGVWELFWPAVLILAGINLLRQAFRPPTAAGDPTGEINSFAIMAGIKRTSGASRFERADLGAIMGGGELDLRRATIPPGEEALVDVFSLMGGYKILVPDDWRIDSRVFAFMGGVEDKTIPPTDALAPRLVVRGALIMGGLHFTN